MADRIVVMNHGRIEQIGTPREIYRRPGSEFVARFFGENNLIPGTVEGSDRGGVLVESALGRFLVPSEAPLPVGAKVMMAVRPEHIRLAPSTAAGAQSVDARIRSVVFYGATSQVALTLASDETIALRASLPTGDFPSLSVGDPVVATWAPDDITVLH